MSDLIERQAALDAICDNCDAVKASCPHYPCGRYVAVEKLPSTPSESQWIPVSERMPEEDHWLGGSGKQFSDNVLISITNREDADAWSDISQTIDGEWRLELPRYCKITAWKPLPEPYREEDTDE